MLFQCSQEHWNKVGYPSIPVASYGVLRGQHRGNFVGKVRPPGARALLRRSPPRQAAGYSPALPIRK
ncbi:MAG: hypothetical protein A2946_03705 [Candidatus Liptonbacteria bacterium RIFCSPLOWO2_01_FULL_53_13]|uniref:Uncharacterized protein n=1 Tax=Candidatus Liptonbacteria bacterium RIFCSPLOWO2_01_FULL_53_13 TaxID=1798651 RepID=A0A1G2CLD2_9BACT|nr:MAG: hypothetical protein A2946_03705 [Candidatus Liptonbacteria bacterium RIFCSPLOWO2_01_FULL_53_13]